VSVSEEKPWLNKEVLTVPQLESHSRKKSHFCFERAELGERTSRTLSPHTHLFDFGIFVCSDDCISQAKSGRRKKKFSPWDLGTLFWKRNRAWVPVSRNSVCTTEYAFIGS